MLTSNAFTMSNISHNVPEPLRSTESGSMGIMVHKANMNGCTYFMYK